MAKDVNRPNNEYDASDIQVLEGLDPVRKRPGMYIGSTGLAGLHHLIWEVVDNSVDEAMAGFCSRIVVTLLADGGCRVDDDGRGIPVDPYPSGPHKGKSAVEVVLTVLHAGGKFGGGSYKVSGGLHGVGVSVVNALSERLVLEVDRTAPATARSSPRAAARRASSRGSARRRPAGRTGTTVVFWPDPTVFSSDGTEFHARTVLERLQTMAFLNKGLEIRFVDERPDKAQEVTYVYKGGIVDFVQATSTPRRRRCSRRWRPTLADEEATRRSRSPSSGTPGTTRASTATPTASPPPRAACTSRASSTALTSVRQQVRPLPQALLKEKDENLLGEDIREGLTAIISVKLKEPQFEGPDQGQAGQRLHPLAGAEGHQREAGRVVARRTRPRPTGWSRRPSAAAQARVAAKNARNAIRRKTALSGVGMPDKLKDCSSSNPERERAVHRRG